MTKGFFAVLGASLLAACVTINVYFPAAAAQQAADRFIEDVWGQDGASPPAGETATPPPQSRAPRADNSLVLALVDIFIPPAAAQDIDISTPAIARLRQAMTARHQQLVSFYQSGAVGLTGNGLVAVRDAASVPASQRNQVQQLVAAENQDRQTLYREVAQANGHPEWESQIQSTFAQQWIANARAGWWYQQGGSWRQK